MRSRYQPIENYGVTGNIRTASGEPKKEGAAGQNPLKAPKIAIARPFWAEFLATSSLPSCACISQP
jgi:hypothetical protein